MGPRATTGFTTPGFPTAIPVHLFGTGSDGRLYWKEWSANRDNTGPWSGPITDKVLGAPPTAVARWIAGLGADRLDVFAIGVPPDNQLYHWAWPATLPVQAFPSAASWQGPSWLGDVLTSAPEAVSDSQNRMNVFARGPNNELLHLRFEQRSFGVFQHWQRWEDLGGALASAPRAVAPWASAFGARGVLHVFIQDQNNDLRHRWFDGVSWGKWETLAGGVTARPGAATIGSTDTVLVAYNVAGVIETQLWESGAWTRHEILTGSVAPTSEPCVHPPIATWIYAGYRRGEGAHVLAQDANGLLVAKRREVQEWSPPNTWEPAGGGVVVSPPQARVRDPATTVGPSGVDVFARGTNDAAYHWTYQ